MFINCMDFVVVRTKMLGAWWKYLLKLIITLLTGLFAIVSSMEELKQKTYLKVHTIDLATQNVPHKESTGENSSVD
jgi:hypothetical protein